MARIILKDLHRQVDNINDCLNQSKKRCELINKKWAYNYGTFYIDRSVDDAFLLKQTATSRGDGIVIIGNTKKKREFYIALRSFLYGAVIGKECTTINYKPKVQYLIAPKHKLKQDHFISRYNDDVLINKINGE